jgi:2-polyprenyl-3-methyl-5-hydroxy-6-metoxy-1,4-benzoquinol methylase
MDTERQKILWDNRQLKRAKDESYKANRKRLETIVAAIDKTTGRRDRSACRLLNIGTGDARLEGMLMDHGYDIHVLDPSQTIVDFAREKYGLDESRARCGWSQDIPYDSDSFDFVVMTEVVEHLDVEAMRQTLEQVRRVLKIDGHFIGTVPENEDLSANSYRCLHCGEVSHRVGHEQSFTVENLRDELARSFQIVRVRAFRGMYMNRKGIIYHHWIDLPYKLARCFKPNVRAPHQIVFNIFFDVRKT